MTSGPDSASLDGRRVLLVEDETLVAFLFQDVLEEEGCVVIGPAASLREALELVEADPMPDAAVVDLNLRGELSWPAIEVLARRGVPFVITSGYVGLDPGREAAAVAVIAKPVSAERLVEAVTRAVSQGDDAPSG
ncbi:MAG TPA: response regulator [Acetobacteraceae bacterium]|jgi:CheY-like chemotaxis protein|nr:response regulator [Acetobacteraceae bacterium]